MKIYRLILELGYYKAYFDFCDIVSATKLAELLLDHQVASDDTKEPSVKLMVIKEQANIIDQEE